jgi:hypothetical protein
VADCSNSSDTVSSLRLVAAPPHPPPPARNQPRAPTLPCEIRPRACVLAMANGLGARARAHPLTHARTHSRTHARAHAHAGARQAVARGFGVASANKKPLADTPLSVFRELTAWPGSCRFERYAAWRARARCRARGVGAGGVEGGGFAWRAGARSTRRTRVCVSWHARTGRLARALV